MKQLLAKMLFALLLLIGASCADSLPEGSETIITESPANIAAASVTAVPLPSPHATDKDKVNDLSPTATMDPTLTQSATSTVLPLTPTAIPPTASPTPKLIDSISLVPVASGFEQPTDLTHANDERLLVLEQSGRIWIIEDNIRTDIPFLDITDRVGSVEFEQGLLGAAFHPEFPPNNTFYVYYTNLNGDSVISRFEVDPAEPDLALASSEEVLLTIQQPYANHNGGQVKFGPDGMLYIGLGDGGSAGDPRNNGQNLSTLLGTILRIDVGTSQGYGIPPDNPFAGDPAIPGEIWAFGLRNPWRFSFDLESGDLYITDVGQSRWEEINFQAASSSGGENYGWNVAEASHCFDADSCNLDGYTGPVAEYSHVDGGCSISGGYVYRGKQHPELWGNYFYGDFCSGFIWSLVQNDAGEWQSNMVLQAGFNISSFGEDYMGELYVLDHTIGTIYRLQP